MPVEMGIWRIDGEEPRRLTEAQLPTEAALETFLERDPSLLGDRLLVIGRQVRTPYNKLIDLLAIDAEGNLHVLELKRERTPRDVVAQLLDYGSWVTTLARDSVIELANAHLGSRTGQPFEAAFEQVFDVAPPDELNGALNLTVVATELDPGSERIVSYLRSFGVPINAVFFSYLGDGDRRYLARSWLVAAEENTNAPTTSKPGKRAEWNGRDWFVSFGGEAARSWQDARTHGFVSAGGGRWYSGSLRSLPVGSRINVHIPGRGYVGVGITLTDARPFDEAQVQQDGTWVPLASQNLIGSYHHDATADRSLDDMAEYVVPVRWITSVPESDAYWERGMFANQNSACKLRQEFTLERLAHHFALDDQE